MDAMFFGSLLRDHVCSSSSSGLLSFLHAKNSKSYSKKINYHNGASGIHTFLRGARPKSVETTDLEEKSINLLTFMEGKNANFVLLRRFHCGFIRLKVANFL